MFEILGYLAIMLAVMLIYFSVFKRPIYEGILVSFAVLLTITGRWSSLGLYIDEALTTSLLYSMMAFSAMSLILTKTKVIDNCVMIIVSLLGRIPGGAGYAAVVASSFMGALSGSGPGNVMATGSITVPAMLKSGYPPELAANVVSASSYLGNMIPPSANIVAALGAFLAVYPDSTITSSEFWVVCWGVSLWFILSRLMQVFAFCKYYKIKAMAKEDIPSLRYVLKHGWSGFLLPLIILAPFVFDAIFNSTFLTARLGAAGAKQFSSSLLIFVGGIVSIYGILIAKNRKELTPKNIITLFADKVKSIAPTVATCVFGYMIGALFADLNVGEKLQTAFADMHMGRVALAFVIPLFTCFLSMVIPGSSIVVMFGAAIISIFASAGADPLLVAAMLPCFCGVMGGITPPFALGMYAGMSIAKSDFNKTLKNDLWWVATQYLLEVIVLLGWLPILGL